MELYRHYKNKKHYIIIEKCMVQIKGKWVGGVIYKPYGGHGTFVRSGEEFFEKFKLVEEL